jgi:hypothetical protein
MSGDPVLSILYAVCCFQASAVIAMTTWVGIRYSGDPRRAHILSIGASFCLMTLLVLSGVIWRAEEGTLSSFRAFLALLAFVLGDYGLIRIWLAGYPIRTPHVPAASVEEEVTYLEDRVAKLECKVHIDPTKPTGE